MPRPPRRRAALALLTTLAGCAPGGPAPTLVELPDRIGATFASAVEAVAGPGAGVPRTRPSTPPPAAARPARPLDGGFAARNLLDGQVVQFDVAHQDGAVTVSAPDGCRFTRTDWFAPSVAWSDCGTGRNWSAGRAEVTELAAIWPLRDGAQGRWRRTARSHTGRTLTRETVCSVTGSQAVVRDTGAPTPAWVVVCRDDKRTRTTWWSPDQGPVAYREVHVDHGVEEAWIRL